LEKHGLTDLTDHDAFFDLFYDEDIRFEFMLAYKKLTRSLNLVFPAKEALDFMSDYQMLTEINVLAGRHFRDQRMSMKGIPNKLRGITDAYLKSKGIDQKVKPISILDKDFEAQVSTHKRSKTKAAEVEHAVRHHIEVDLDDDPELQASFAEALALIFKEYKDNWERIYKELEKLRQRIKEAEKEPTYGLHKKKQMPFFRMFKRELFGADELTEDQVTKLVGLTKDIYEVVECELKMTGFWESAPARNKLKAQLQEVLLSKDYMDLPNIMDNYSQIIARIMELADKNNDRILYAA
jgi:type I restriction enzyme R subunit